MQKREADPRDARDLLVLAQRQHGLSAREIAKRARLDPDTVATILALDAAAFPDEPLRGAA